VLSAIFAERVEVCHAHLRPTITPITFGAARYLSPRSQRVRLRGFSGRQQAALPRAQKETALRLAGRFSSEEGDEYESWSPKRDSSISKKSRRAPLF
jgi:hypothetical protein